MSRLTDLLHSVEKTDPKTAADIRKEIAAITHNQRTFGLVYEKHQPEAVQLPGISVRKGAKVSILSPRGSTAKADKALWQVEHINRSNNNKPIARLVAIDPTVVDPADLLRIESPVEDLVVVAEFQDRIFPGLLETGRIERGGDAPFHSVINAENFHALEMLTYTHRHSVDAIYIDPPYNTGAKDWKYNNDYVDSDDIYLHSKWLSFMERRIKLAKELLKPENSVLIVTIDEKEYLRLGLLLEQVFPESRIQMVSTLITPQGNPRKGQFYRTDEYIFFVQIGESAPSPLPLGDHWRSGSGEAPKKNVNWPSLLRTGSSRLRSDRPAMFYPVFIYKDDDGPLIHSIGEPFYGENLQDCVAPKGTTAVWPVGNDGELRRWQVSNTSARKLLKDGFLRLGKWNGENTAISYMPKTNQGKILSGEIPIKGKRYDGSYIVSESYVSEFVPGTLWKIPSHDATRGGTQLIRKLIPGRKFPFPKSLYAVEDVLRFFVKSKKDAVVVDFFSGSGTTAHAVMRLNKQDGGRRKAVLITNNEVSIDEQKTLIKKKLRPGDPEWEKLGICDYVTKPRITAAITGKTPEGKPVEGDYKFIDEFPMSDGFEANAAFFTLTYESPLQIRHNRAFKKIAPLLWLRAGSRGRIIESLGEKGWDIAENYAVIENLDQLKDFSQALSEHKVGTIFVVTDDSGSFEMATRNLPADAKIIRLYSSYLENFEINSGRSL